VAVRVCWNEKVTAAGGAGRRECNHMTTGNLTMLVSSRCTKCCVPQTIQMQAWVAQRWFFVCMHTLPSGMSAFAITSSCWACSLCRTLRCTCDCLGICAKVDCTCCRGVIVGRRGVAVTRSTAQRQAQSVS
jgi:hypothetical protein